MQSAKCDSQAFLFPILNTGGVTMGDTENKIPLRSEVAVENTWALEDLYATDDDWKADMERLKSMMQQACG